MKRPWAILAIGFLVVPLSAASQTRTVRVRADRDWTPTNIVVREGERISIRARGNIIWSTKFGESTDPDGAFVEAGHFRPLSKSGVGALIGRVGDQVFFVGSMSSGSSPASGELFLGINDDKFSDNEGQFIVDIRSERGRSSDSWAEDSWSSGWSSSRQGGRGYGQDSWGGPWGSEPESFRWRGRVDGVDDVVIRGNAVRIQHHRHKPIQNQDYRFSAPLPRREVELDLRKIEGRGRIRLIQKPDAWNNYTAVVQLDDGDKMGDAEYEFELVWKPDRYDSSGGRWGEGSGTSYDEGGVFVWKGRVDIGAEIVIQGRRHRVEDEGGQGTQEQGARFSEPLPSRPVPVSLRKRDGRGRVELVQIPEVGNQYTAIVRIEDPKSGADTYEFELTWARQ
jgi:hypothetical protein